MMSRTAATYQGQLVFPPHCAIHTHSTTDTKFDNIITLSTRNQNPKQSFSLRGHCLSPLFINRAMTCTCDLCSVPAKFQVSLQFVPDLLDLLDDLLDDLNHKFDPLIINMLLAREP